MLLQEKVKQGEPIRRQGFDVEGLKEETRQAERKLNQAKRERGRKFKTYRPDTIEDVKRYLMIQELQEFARQKAKRSIENFLFGFGVEPNQDTIEDSLSEGVTVILEKLSNNTYNFNIPFIANLAGISRYQYINLYRKAKEDRTDSIEARQANISGLEVYQTNEEDYTQTIDNRYHGKMLIATQDREEEEKQAIKSISEYARNKQDKRILLHIALFYSYQEISNNLKMPIDTIKSRIRTMGRNYKERQAKKTIFKRIKRKVHFQEVHVKTLNFNKVKINSKVRHELGYFIANGYKSIDPNNYDSISILR